MLAFRSFFFNFTTVALQIPKSLLTVCSFQLCSTFEVHEGGQKNKLVERLTEIETIICLEASGTCPIFRFN